MKSSPLARRWSAWRSQANTKAFSTSSRSTCSAASSACSSTTAKRSPSRMRWSSVSLVARTGGRLALRAASTGWRSKSRSVARPLPARLERLGDRFLAGVLAMPPILEPDRPVTGRARLAAAAVQAQDALRAGAGRALRARAPGPARSARSARRRPGRWARAPGRCECPRSRGRPAGRAELDEPELAHHREQAGAQLRRARVAARRRGAPARAPRARRSAELAQRAEAARSSAGRSWSPWRQAASANSTSAGPHARCACAVARQQRVAALRRAGGRAPPGGRSPRPAAGRGRARPMTPPPGRRRRGRRPASPATRAGGPRRPRPRARARRSRSARPPRRRTRRLRAGRRCPPGSASAAAGSPASSRRATRGQKGSSSPSARTAPGSVSQSARSTIRGSSTPFQRLRSSRSTMSCGAPPAAVSDAGDEPKATPREREPPAVTSVKRACWRSSPMPATFSTRDAGNEQGRLRVAGAERAEALELLGELEPSAPPGTTASTRSRRSRSAGSARRRRAPPARAGRARSPRPGAPPRPPSGDRRSEAGARRTLRAPRGGRTA